MGPLDARQGRVQVDPDLPMIRQGHATVDALLERQRAHAKHAAKGQSAEQMAHDDPLWLPVLVEEVGEVARALNDREPLEHLRAEAIQVAAMALAYADALEEAMLTEAVATAKPYPWRLGQPRDA